MYNSLLIHNISLGQGFLILPSLSVFFLLFIIRHDNVLSGLFFFFSVFGGISKSQALGVFVILSSPPPQFCLFLLLLLLILPLSLSFVLLIFF